LTSDGEQLLCTTVNTAYDKDQNVSAALQQIDYLVNSIAPRTQTTPPPPSYVGLTTSASNGLFLSNQSSVEGVQAAANLCAAQSGSGAHLCTMDELYQAVVNGTLKATDKLPQSWVYMPNWNILVNSGTTSEPKGGIADNCGGYTSRSASTGWHGILAEWGPLPDGTPGFRWHGGEDAYCGSAHQITCCK
jgi:hypothetical protein